MARAGKYYDAGQGRAAQVEALFSRIAPRYDLINDLQSAGLHRLWKRRLVALAQVPDGGRALDLCCGTGDVVRALARRYPRAGSIAGLDFTMPMLAVARARDGAASSPSRAARVSYVQADALNVPAPDASFDRVTIAYGLRNVADLAACLAEIRRVLRPGGRFVALEFGKPTNPILARAYFAYLRMVVPIFGRLFFGDPDTHGYILDSLQRYPGQAQVAELLRGAGFARVHVENPLLGIMGIHVADV